LKKKELIGDFKNGGSEWQPARKPAQVNVYDFPDRADGKAIPYGVCTTNPQLLRKTYAARENPTGSAREKSTTEK
jgi:hypothetical protein